MVEGKFIGDADWASWSGIDPELSWVAAGGFPLPPPTLISVEVEIDFGPEAECGMAGCVWHVRAIGYHTVTGPRPRYKYQVVMPSGGRWRPAFLCTGTQSEVSAWVRSNVSRTQRESNEVQMMALTKKKPGAPVRWVWIQKLKKGEGKWVVMRRKGERSSEKLFKD